MQGKHGVIQHKCRPKDSFDQREYESPEIRRLLVKIYHRTNVRGEEDKPKRAVFFGDFDEGVVTFVHMISVALLVAWCG